MLVIKFKVVFDFVRFSYLEDERVSVFIKEEPQQVTLDDGELCSFFGVFFTHMNYNLV